MKCPNCRLAMSSIKYEGALVHQCTNCMGHWLETLELRTIVSIRQILFDRDEAMRLAKSEPDRSVSEAEQERSLACPACNQSLQARKYADDGPITFNWCDSCEGVWLDHQELELVQMFVEGVKDLLEPSA